MAVPQLASPIDSLQRRASVASNPVERIKILSQLAVNTRQSPDEEHYLIELFHLATDLDSVELAYNTAAELSRYYYNEDENDSLMVWVAYIDSVSEQIGQYPDAFFNVHSYICQGLLWSGNYELALNDAIRLQNMARKVKQPYGMVCCSENLGLIYQEIRRDSDAIVAFQETLKGLEVMENTLRHRISLIGNMLESYLRTGKNDDAEKYILHGLTLLNEQEMVNTRTGSLFPINKYRSMLYSFYSHVYMNRHQLDKADFTLKKAALYRAKNTEPNSNYINFIYNCARAYYYKATGDYASAMLVIDGLLKENHTHEALQFKIDLLLAQGKYKEVVPLYKEIITLTSKCNNDAFNRQINQLRTIHDLNNKEIQERELKISQMQLTAGRRWLVFSMSFSAVLLCLLYILYLYYKRTHRLKNELLREKDSLLESEKQLRIAKEHAEEASLIKSNFIANISHEIRTPLNAIVGFSGLLTDPSVEEEDKASFSTIINNNTDLLLNLINDVLDLSRLESSNMKFNIKQCDLIICCRCALDSIRHRVSAGVGVFFTPPSPSLMLLTDSLRLQQLLINLLTNAAKFTEHGSITLSIEVDEEKRQVRLVVTDTGCGVPPAMQSIIFGRFEKLDEYVQGTGLGLSICQVIADRLEGNLSLDSSYTTGARFIFIHPYNQAE